MGKHKNDLPVRSNAIWICISPLSSFTRFCRLVSIAKAFRKQPCGRGSNTD